MNENEDLEERKLLGSGGYAFAKITEEEETKANLGIPQWFLKYYCNKCGKEYDGSPDIKFENPNEDLGQGMILVEKGEYKCKNCNSIIAFYRTFNK